MMLLSAIRKFILAGLFCLLTGFAALAQETAPATKPAAVPTATEKPAEKIIATPQISGALGRATRSLEALKAELKTSRTEINSPAATIEELAGEREKLVDLRKQIAISRDQLETPIADISARLAELGPAPKKGETEAATIAEKRAELKKTLKALQAAAKEFDLLELETGQLTSLTSKIEKQAFVARIFVSRKSVINPTLWTDFSVTLTDMVLRTKSVFLAWSKPAGADGKISGTNSMVFALVVFFITTLSAIFIWTKMANPPQRLAQATDLRRSWRAVGGTVIVAALSGLAVYISLAGLEQSTVTDLRISRLVIAIGQIIFGIAMMVTVLRAIIAPANNDWRLVDMDDASATKFFRTGLLAAVVFGADRGAGALAGITFLPLEFIVGIHALTAIFLVVLIARMISVARRSLPLDGDDANGQKRVFFFRWASRFFVPTWGLLILSVLSLVFGYVALAHFILTNILVTGALVISLYLVHHLVDALVLSSMQPWSHTGKALRSKMGLGDETIRRLGLILSTVTDIAVIIIGLPLIMILWTITWIDFSSVAATAFFGFKIGDVVIEPSKIVLSIGLLVTGIILVRAFTSWLNRRILDRTTIDSGIKNSIATGAKYTGLMLVAGLALTSAGLDFSKLAIVAGALSVGIGFGLQSVVSNFVSGLILLAERPIRIGDWISVSGGEGTVKKINVRSTEIITFDRCSVIIPNSAFITDPVQNWSHGSSVGRIKIDVGVSYGSDPKEVEKALLKCAHAHKGVVATPYPRVMFMDFADSALVFQLRVFLADIGDCTQISSDLRFAIFAELAKQGIELPFPQRDINIRDLDKVSEAFKPLATPKKAAPRKRAAKKS